MTRLFFSPMLLLSTISLGVQVNPECVRGSRSLGSLAVEHDSSGFRVNGSPVQPAFMSRELRGMDTETLGRLLQAGHLRVSQLDDGQYSLRSHVHGGGGGPILAGSVYVAVKTVMWGGIIAGVATGVVKPEFGGRQRRAEASTATVMAAEAVTTQITRSGVPGGASVIAAGLGNSERGRRLTQGAVSVAATTGAGAIAAYGGVAGFVESCAVTAAAWAAALPTP